MLAWLRSEIGGESNPFGQTARETDFPDPPVCPPRVEGVANHRRPLPSLFAHRTIARHPGPPAFS
jgi:hypothetical protein